ncbi:MAG: hypothetical protein ABI645_00960 [Pseudomonadota bacterium]
MTGFCNDQASAKTGLPIRAWRMMRLIGLQLVAGIALILIAYLLLRATSKLPIGKFFGYSSALIAVLAIVLVGKGVVALQEAGWVNIHSINGPRLSVLACIPTCSPSSDSASLSL